MRSKASLGSSREVAQGCGVSFINCLYLVPLIIGQNFCATCAIVLEQTKQGLIGRGRWAAAINAEDVELVRDGGELPLLLV